MLGTSIYLLYKDENNNKVIAKDNELKITKDSEINIGITDYDTINPILSYNRDIQYLDKLIFDSLLNISSDFKIENSLAKEYSKLNSISYLIKLKEDVNWHDGSKFTAKDVIFTINSLKNKNIKSIYKENIAKIKNIEEIDDYTIKIILEEEVPFFEYMLCFPILSKDEYDENTLESKEKIPIGTGKYKIVKISEELIKLQNKELDKVINVYLKRSAKDLYNSLSKNEIDIIITDNIEYDEYIGKIGYDVKSSKNREFNYLVFNNQNKILNNKEIRKAISKSIDRQVVNYNVYKNKYVICDFPIDYGNYLYKGNKIFDYNIVETKNILIKEGWNYKNNSWTKQNNTLEFSLLVNQENAKRVVAAEEIKKQLEKTGIKINIVKVNFNMYNSYIKNKNYDMILAENIVSNSPNIETYFDENNLSNFYNEEILQILNDVKAIDNEKLLKEKYQRIEEIYLEEIPFVSLYTNSLFLLTNKELKGDLSHNWYNVFYNINNWYKIKN